jgi:hypothetical protein
MHLAMSEITLDSLGMYYILYDMRKYVLFYFYSDPFNEKKAIMRRKQ